ncbi:cell wall-associated protease domain protein [Acinetobacter baumannii 1096934]|nr:cell wall-associated protease domain protein [Acinetobacter baumannii 1096934]
MTDAAGNTSETAVQKVVVDTTTPQAGELTLSDLNDTGVSVTDQITQDKNFNLKLASSTDCDWGTSRFTRPL